MCKKTGDDERRGRLNRDAEQAERDCVYGGVASSTCCVSAVPEAATEW